MNAGKALKWVLFWVSLALLFNVGVFLFGGKELALQFFGGYLIELSLSVDNLFLFLVIFSSLGVDVRYQRRALNYGIAGAIVMRLLFILLGSALVQRFEWMLYVFGAVLILSGTRMLLLNEKEKNFRDSRSMSVISRIMPFTGTLEGEKFFVRRNGRLHATLLFAVLLLVEFSDILFAVDSIPAIFSITTNVIIVYTSNIFAILGLRSLYFMLERLCRLFRYMKYGVAVVLLFTGVKLAILIFHVDIPILVSIAVIAAILAVSMLASVTAGKQKGAAVKI